MGEVIRRYSSVTELLALNLTNNSNKRNDKQIRDLNDVIHAKVQA